MFPRRLIRWPLLLMLVLAAALGQLSSAAAGGLNVRDAGFAKIRANVTCFAPAWREQSLSYYPAKEVTFNASTSRMSVT